MQIHNPVYFRLVRNDASWRFGNLWVQNEAQRLLTTVNTPIIILNMTRQAMKDHPNKHIQAAIEYALSAGWHFRQGKGHAFGRLYCGTHEHHEHQMSVWSTPRNPENHARQIHRKVNICRLITPDRQE